MHAIILSIGDELASGLTTNTNSAFLAQQLTSIGIATTAHITVRDHLPSIITAIRDSCDHLELDASTGKPCGILGILLITGGLGPTADDLTRQALADALGEQLVEDPDAMLQIESWFRSKGRTMSASNRLQALRPHSASIIENTCGTAPGLHTQRNHNHIFVMPGVPREMRDMFSQFIFPTLQSLLAEASPNPTITRVTKINTFGTGESIIGEKITDLMVRGGISQPDGSHLDVGTTVADGIVSVRIYATGTRPQTDALIAQTRATLLERLGPIIFGHDEDALETALAKLLLDRRQTLATAESCTGGLLATLLTNTPGSSAYFHRGWVTYANAAKHDELAVPGRLLAEHGAVSEPVARAMAEGARKFANTDFALATTGIAGPDGGSPEKPVGTVWIALASPAGTDARRFIFPGNRQGIRLRASQMALALLRWHLLGIPAPV